MSLHKQIINFNAAVTKEIDTIYRDIALELHRRIVNKTPIDTGRAKANWNLSSGSPDTTVTDSTTPNSPNIGSPKAGVDELWIANYLHYIYALEFGHSSQAPSGMVVLSMQEMPAWVQSKMKGKV